MDEEYRSDILESTTNPSNQTESGTRETSAGTNLCSVPIPRPLTDYEKIVLKHYGADTDIFGTSLNMFAEWVGRWRSIVGVMRDLGGNVPLEFDGKLLATLHAVERMFDDFDILLKLAHDILPNDPTVLRRIERAHGPLLSSSLTAKGDADSADTETLQ